MDSKTSTRTQYDSIVTLELAVVDFAGLALLSLVSMLNTIPGQAGRRRIFCGNVSLAATMAFVAMISADAADCRADD